MYNQTKKESPISVIEFGMIGGVVSDVQPNKKELPIVFTESEMTGGVVSDVQPNKKE
jgi:hypothetical protein